MISTIVVALLVLFFIFVAYMSSKTWRGSHVALLVGVFFFILLFTLLSGMALKTHEAWQKKHGDLANRLQRAQTELAEIEEGSADGEVASRRALQGQLRRLLIDRSRVWRSVTPVGQVGENAYGLNMAGWGDSGCIRVGDEDELDELDEPPEPIADPAADQPQPDAADGGAPAVTDHGIQQGMVLYGFLEASTQQLNEAQQAALFGDSDLATSDPRGLCRVPAYYVGSFQVTSVNGSEVVVSPILVPDERQLAALQAPTSSWALYEVMPVDRHDSLAGLSAEQIAALFPEDFAATAKEYARDLQPAVASDPPERTMTKIKFTRDYEVAVDVDGDEPGIDKNFDPSGRAIVAQLRQGEPTQFKAGDEPAVYFDTETANELRRDGVCEFVDEQPIFARPLRDYSYYYYQKTQQIRNLKSQMDSLKAENAAVAESAERAREQTVYREQEIQQLNQDRDNIRSELEVLERFYTVLKQRFDEQRLTLSSLYRTNAKFGRP